MVLVVLLCQSVNVRLDAQSVCVPVCVCIFFVASDAC